MYITAFIVATQIFYTIAFFGTVIAGIGSTLILLNCMPEKMQIIHITNALGITLVVSGKF